LNRAVDGLARLRGEVREFLAQTPFVPRCDSWMRSFDRGFTRALAERGWLGMAIPTEFGGQGRTYTERFVVTEELLRAGAPIAAHWIADRQVAPTILAHGSDELRQELLPGICRGDITFCIGISEPNAGSDVAAIATSARPNEGGWQVTGQKTWTTGAADSDYMYLIARTARGDDRHAGLSEFVVAMNTPGITVRPIEDLAGERHFCDVFFDEVNLGPSALVGQPGHAFKQVLRQLDFERSGPERLLSTYPLFESLLACGSPHDEADIAAIGRLGARYAALRAISYAIAERMDGSGPPTMLAAIAKDLGNELERDVVDTASDMPGLAASADEFRRHLFAASQYVPAFSLRGGSTEIMREIVQRALFKTSPRR
jgi:alkylation response protein AidB-like acyl-CoA dehydrogenase